MKKFILSLLTLACLQSARAQFVTIPDPEMVNYLTTYFPNCMNGNDLDTTCFEIQNVTNPSSSDLLNYSIIDLTGIEYFQGLDILYVPPTVQLLNELPDALGGIEMYNNNFIGFFPNIPSSVLTITIDNCSQFNGFSNLPSNLTSLTVHACPNVTNLPSLPTSLDFLDIICPNLHVLPTLPTNLNQLYYDQSVIPCIPNYYAGMSANGINDIICETNSVYNPYNAPGVLPTNWVFIEEEYEHLTYTLSGLFNTNLFPQGYYDTTSALAFYQMTLTASPNFNDTIDLSEIHYFGDDIYEFGVNGMFNANHTILGLSNINALTNLNHVFFSNCGDVDLSGVNLQLPVATLNGPSHLSFDNCHIVNLSNSHFTTDNFSISSCDTLDLSGMILGELSKPTQFFASGITDLICLGTQIYISEGAGTPSISMFNSYVTHFPTFILSELPFSSSTIYEFQEVQSDNWQSLLLLDSTNQSQINLPELNLNFYQTDIDTLNSLPVSTISLIVDSSQLSSIPLLSNRTRQLIIKESQLNSFQDLSLYAGLDEIDFSGNQIESLPSGVLPLYTNAATNSQYMSVNLAGNELTNIANDFLAGIDSTDVNYVIDLNLSNNPLLANLPDFDVLDSTTTISLNVSNNTALNCISPISNNYTIDYTNSGITCLPSVPNQSTPNFILCLPNDPTNNPNDCFSQPVVVGSITNDVDTSCSVSVGDDFPFNVPVSILDLNNNQLAITNSDNVGKFNLTVPDGDYLVVLNDANEPYYNVCLNDTLPANVSNNTLTTPIDFFIQCDGVDAGVAYINRQGIVFPGQNHKIKIGAGDLALSNGMNCMEGIGGTVVVTVNGPVSSNGTFGDIMPVVSGNTFVFTVPDFSTINENTAFQIGMLTDTTATSSDQVCVSVSVTVNGATDVDTINNVRTHCYAVVNSFDPNEKEVYPSTILPGSTEYLTYTIHFQNTGNAPAFNIRLVDTLESNLDWSTFEYLGASHTNNYYIADSRLVVRFDNILLPDSTTDLEGSQGFFQFRVRPFGGLADGDSVSNHAGIYFDYNQPIITNNAVTQIDDQLDLMDQSTFNIQLYPNPASNVFHVVNNSGYTISNVLLIDIQGKVIYESVDLKATQNTIDVSAFANGFYTLQMTVAGKVNKMKVVVLK